MDHLAEAKAAEERERFLKETLFKVALSNTAYDDQGKPPCDEDTRVEILADIKRWVDNVSAESQNFFWLTGDPGCGKSAITASLARHCKDSGNLWAQFFINRNNEATTNPRVYFPSIARQMIRHATSDQTITKTIYEIIKRKPSVLDQMTLDQALGLFVETVQAACDVDPTQSVVIVIDGLDETRRDKLQDTAKVFSELFKTLKRPNAKVFISSRTDDEITKPFYRALRCDDRHVKHIHLNTSDPSSIRDVSRYLFRNIKLLVEEWDLNWEQWPGEERLKVLCLRASGLFIWAVTVVKFFQEQLRQSKHERLNELLHVINDEGMGDVNKLYGKILEITYDVETNTRAQNDWEHEKFRWIVGFIILTREPLPVGDIGELLDLRRMPNSNPVNVVHFVTNLRTVLVSGTGVISNETIPRLHKSFVEYITSERADVQFRIDVPVVDSQIAAKCLRLVCRGRNGGKGVESPAGCVGYAIHNWTRHLPSEGIPESGVAIVGGDVEGLTRFLSTTRGLSEGFMSASGDYRTQMFDPKIGLPPPVPYGHSSNIKVGMRVWDIAVSSDSRLIASGSDRGFVEIWDSRSYKQIRMRGQHTGRVRSVFFSPDSSWLVSGGDNTVGMWGCQTGHVIGMLLGHTDEVNSVCTDGQRIISGSSDKTIRIWRCDKRRLIGTPICVGRIVRAIALSKDGRIAAGVDFDVCIFDIETRQQIATIRGHSKVWTVAFSPDGSRIFSGCWDGMIHISDVQKGKQILVLYGHTELVRSVAFSPNGQWIASGSDDRTVRMWLTETGQPIGLPLTRHTDSVTSVAFLDNSQLVSGSFDTTIHIWAHDEKPSQQITAIHFSPSRHPDASSIDRISLEGHPSIISASFSPDGFLYAASIMEGHICVWNTERKLLWEESAAIHPIHLLRFSEEQLVLSAPDGSTVTWNLLLDGNPSHEKALKRGPQLCAAEHPPKLFNDSDMVSWFPFRFDAGLWAYVDGTFISFQGKDRFVTIMDVEKLSG